MKNENLKKIVLTATFAAIAFLFTFIFKFKVGFLTFDFKDAIISLISLVLGPVYGLTAVTVVTFLEFISFSETGPYGLIMNFISSGAFALLIGGIYKYKRTFSGAILASVVSVLGVTAIMMGANLLITPYYMGVARSEVSAMIPTLLLPFNLAKTTINAATTLIIYKPVTTVLRRFRLIAKKENNVKLFNKKSVILYIVSALVIALAVFFIIFVLKGGFEIVSKSA